MKYKDIIEELINAKLSNIKDETVQINDGKPLFTKKDYEIIEGQPKYFELDKYGRSNGAIALVSKNTLPLIINRDLKYPDPYGWTKNLENKNVYERCHTIAYNLSAQLPDRKNFFIGTEHLNTSTMIKIENRVKSYIENNDSSVLYRVTIKYKGKNQIPTGILIEAQSMDNELSICEFCYNIQGQVKINYKDGTIIKDERNTKETKGNISKKKTTKDKDENKEKNKDYILNRKTSEIHLDNNCSKLKNIEPKYLQGTTTTISELLEVNLKPCSKCINKSSK